MLEPELGKYFPGKAVQYMNCSHQGPMEWRVDQAGNKQTITFALTNCTHLEEHHSANEVIDPASARK